MTNGIVKFQLTEDQKAALAATRRQLEKEKPELISESKRIAKAAEKTQVKLASAFANLKMSKSENDS